MELEDLELTISSYVYYVSEYSPNSNAYNNHKVDLVSVFQIIEEEE